MMKRFLNRGGAPTSVFSEMMMTAPMITILLLFSVFPFILSLISIEKFTFSDFLSIIRDTSMRLTLMVSLSYALISVVISINMSMRLAYRLYFSGRWFRSICLSILFLSWLLPTFIAIPLYRSVMYWFTDNLIHSQLLAFTITTSARIWVNIPLITLIAFASIGQTSKHQIEMMKTEGASSEHIYRYLFKPSTKKVIGTFSLILFINSMRDLNIPIMMTGGRPYISDGFTAFGIAGSTTTFGLFLKDSLLRLNIDLITYTQALFATVIILLMFFCLYGLRKKQLIFIFLCIGVDLLFFPTLSTAFTAVMLLFVHYQSKKYQLKQLHKMILMIIPFLINACFLNCFTPGLLIAIACFFFYPQKTSLLSGKKGQYKESIKTIWNYTGDVLNIIWYLLTAAVFVNLMKLMFSDPLYIPSWNEWDTFTANNFFELFQNGFSTNILNSLILGFASSAIIVITVFPAGYTATIRKRFNRGMNSLIIFSLAITGMNTIIPLFMMFRGVHLTDTYLSVILTIVNHSIPLAYLVVTEEMKKISPSYLDTARLEGASHIQIFLKIILPLIIPIAAVVSLKVIVDGFSSFTAPLMFINSPDKFPVALKLFSYAGKDSLMYPEWGLFTAGSGVSILILFWLIFPFRRFLMKGIYRSWSDD